MPKTKEGLNGLFKTGNGNQLLTEIKQRLDQLKIQSDGFGNIMLPENLVVWVASQNPKANFSGRRQVVSVNFRQSIINLGEITGPVNLRVTVWPHELIIWQIDNQ